MRRTLLLLALVIVTVDNACAQPTDRTASSFSARVEAGAAFASTTDQLFAHGDRRIDNLESSADRSGAVLPLLLFDLRYRGRTEGPEVFLGTPLDTDTLGLTLGLGQSWEGVGTLEVAGIANPWSEVWDDPYRTTGKRDATWARQYGGRVRWSSITGSGAEVTYTGLYTRVADDAAGERFEQLRRSGWSHELALGYRIPLAPGAFLVPSVTGVLGDFRGDAESYTGVQGGLSALWLRESLVVNVSLEAGCLRYLEDHPLFEERREDVNFGATAVVTLPGLFGMPRLFADFVAAYGARDSNLGFFDAETVLGAVALGYSL